MSDDISVETALAVVRDRLPEVPEKLRRTEALEAFYREHPDVESLVEQARIAYNIGSAIGDASLDTIIETAQANGKFGIDVLRDMGMSEEEAQRESRNYRFRKHYRSSLALDANASEQQDGSADGATSEQANEQQIITPEQAWEIVKHAAQRNPAFQAQTRVEIMGGVTALGIFTTVDADKESRELKKGEQEVEPELDPHYRLRIETQTLVMVDQDEQIRTFELCQSIGISASPLNPYE